MGAVNPNWHRWVYASISKHLRTAADAASLPLVIEFTDDKDDVWKAAPRKAEALITGPSTKGQNGGEFRVTSDVLVKITSDRSGNDYPHLDATGVIAEALDQCILVMDYGATGALLVGELKPSKDEGEEIDVEHLQPLETDDQIHSLVQVRYSGNFNE